MKKKIKDMMSNLGIPQEAIDAQMNSIETMLDGHDIIKQLRPLTLKELKELPKDQWDKLYSLCWKNGRPRCSTIGISDLEIKQASEPDHFNITFSDGNGDPRIQWIKNETKIHKVGDGTWDYGLYLKK